MKIAFNSFKNVEDLENQLFDEMERYDTHTLLVCGFLTFLFIVHAMNKTLEIVFWFLTGIFEFLLKSLIYVGYFILMAFIFIADSAIKIRIKLSSYADEIILHHPGLGTVVTAVLVVAYIIFVIIRGAFMGIFYIALGIVLMLLFLISLLVEWSVRMFHRP